MKHTIIDDAISLPADKRAELVDILIKSLNPTIEKKIDKLWAGEAEKRLESIKKKSVTTIPADEVFSRIRKA
ncbi:MAG TPA: addiction module protein [Spirochaetota bacterium]|nr:addiction module protein [Spirochaetota bacterium]